MAVGDEHPDVVRLAELNAEALVGGGAAKQRRQRRLGNMLARERIDYLVDEGSFAEMGRLQRLSTPTGETAGSLGDGVVGGLAAIDGRPVAVYTCDVTVLRGAVGVGAARKITRLLEVAQAQRLPVINIHDSDGVRLTDGPAAMAGFAEILGRQAALSGWVPQISVALGLCVGGAAYGAALQDVVIGQRESAFLFVTGSKVAEVVTGRHAPIEDLGGVDMHSRKTGLVHLAFDDEKACLDAARRVLAFLPQSAADSAPSTHCDDPVDRDCSGVMKTLPDSQRKGYDMRKLITDVVDRDSFLELQEHYARNLVVGFARLGGASVGIVGSQPRHYAGCLDVESSRKGARFIQLCSAFGIPVITLCDVPGFLPGVEQEQGGLLLHGAKLISAYAGCRSPLLSLVVRKSYGGGNVLAFPADLRFAYPLARVQPMGMEAAKAVAAHSSFGELGEDPEEVVRKRLGDRYDSMEISAEAGLFDEAIHPIDTRRTLVRALRSLAREPRRNLPPRRHSNIPL